ncbi:uncharacterized protein I303_101382 [Kwoniella dejecticola CBS 10117]|uniref:Uncharacterized protein n=1 Tax=Kwoniella dejecticola CBS 10117 TaxID=1296121 RepID=A0A1A6AHS2_9TREE|nr:uncharacterized protein I303_01391 [Kwoniella dejecticola CBS 10117]OBR89563.1 hypothetical protein I303_01391 [Kwoniella dejecticola CBS 10117]
MPMNFALDNDDTEDPASYWQRRESNAQMTTAPPTTRIAITRKDTQQSIWLDISGVEERDITDTFLTQYGLRNSIERRMLTPPASSHDQFSITLTRPDGTTYDAGISAEASRVLHDVLASAIRDHENLQAREKRGAWQKRVILGLGTLFLGATASFMASDLAVSDLSTENRVLKRQVEAFQKASMTPTPGDVQSICVMLDDGSKGHFEQDDESGAPVFVVDEGAIE